MKKLLLFLLCIVPSVFFAQQSYYNDVDLTKSGLLLKDELSTKIYNTHTNTLDYNGAREALKIIDLVPNQGDDVYLLYGYSNNTCPSSTGDDHRTRNKSYFGGGSSCEWNREHTYPKSLGSPNLGTSGPGADVHHLRASDVSRNSSRGSLKFIDGSGNSRSIGSGWYPGDEWKGDVARMMMYMYLRYGDRCYPSNVTIGSTNSVDSNMIDLLLEWNSEDPVSTYEENRNTYLENTSNLYGQGNRNPFIDNPNLATQIWGGPVAEDKWNTTPDTEKPSTPTDLVSSNITNTTVDLNWTASTDNIAVSSYDIKVDGAIYSSSTTNATTLNGLTKNTTYSILVLAKDAAGNISENSNTISVKTTNIIDTTPPSTITDLSSSNISSSSVVLSWTASTDNVEVTSYEVFKNGTLLESITTNSYTAISLSSETTYNFTVYAKDAVNNISEVSNTETITTLPQSTFCGSETFTIATGAPTGGYGDGNFVGDNNVTWYYTQARDDQGYEITGNSLMLRRLSSSSNVKSESVSGGIGNFTCKLKKAYTGSGNRQVELFINGISKGTSVAWDDTNIQTFSVENINISGDVIIEIRNISEKQLVVDDISWTCFSTLSNDDINESLFNVYPNPSKNNQITISLINNEINSIELFSITGQLIKNINNPTTRNNKVIIQNIPSGIYLLKVKGKNTVSTKRVLIE